MTKLFLLHETAVGYALFQASINEIIDLYSDKVQRDFMEYSHFSRIVKLISFSAFRSFYIALGNINSICSNKMSEELEKFLQISIPKEYKLKRQNNQIHLGIIEPHLGIEIKSKLGITCICNDTVREILRGVRFHFDRFTTDLTDSNQRRIHIGMSHAFSRTKFNIRKTDNMIIHASSLLETLDKDINLFLMKIREWYGWHFPELSKFVEDKHQYLRILLILRNKTNMTWEYICLLTEILGNSCKAKIIIEAARSSMGQKICTTDMVNIEIFAKHIVELSEYRQKLSDYIKSKMQTIAPNLSALVGFFVGSKLISQAGSLMNLAKCSASTVQILGAEKALFRAKISKQNTPKHGIIYHCSYVGRVRQRNKGRISRYVANKCAIAARVDAFMDGLTSNAFGIKLKDQVENRIRFYDEGAAETKNITAMQEVLRSIENN